MMPDELVEKVARGLYAARPFIMVTTETTQGHQLARCFEWDGAPHYYQEDMRRLAQAAIAAMPRLEALVEALGVADSAMTCGREDNACYCPNCDNSLFDARAKVRAALQGESENGG